MRSLPFHLFNSINNDFCVPVIVVWNENSDPDHRSIAPSHHHTIATSQHRHYSSLRDLHLTFCFTFKKLFYSKTYFFGTQRGSPSSGAQISRQVEGTLSFSSSLSEISVRRARSKQSVNLVFCSSASCSCKHFHIHNNVCFLQSQTG